MDDYQLGEDEPYNGTTVPIGIVFGRINAAFLLLLFIVGLPWNALVIGMILKKKLFTRPSVMLLLNLAISNFLVCLLIMPFPIVLGIMARGQTPDKFLALDKVCQSGILLVLFIIATIYTVALMSVDRVIYLSKPLSYEGIVTPWRMFFAIVFVWLSCAAISLPPLFGFGRVGYDTSLVLCSIYIRDLGNPSYNSNRYHYMILIICFAMFGTLTQLFGCGCIIYITRKALLKRLHKMVGTSRSQRNEQSSDVLRNYAKSQLQLVKVFGAIFAASLITVLPSVVFGISIPISGNGDSVIRSYLYVIAYITVLSKSVIHPILEAYMTHEIRSVISKFSSSIARRPTPYHPKTTVNEYTIRGTDIEGKTF